MAVDSYDEIPYDSTPIYETHPANLAVPGALFGLDPAAPQHCRYLELGCAGGGNLIPLAWHLPDSEFVGIERSFEQVQAGQALIAALGLRNIRLEQADVLDLDPRTLGEFDYIVAHGFFSWVPAVVRTRMWEIISGTLAAQGIAYVSYNVYPGWRQRGRLRDFLRYHVRNLDAPRARLAAAQQGLMQWEQALAGRSDGQSVSLRDEITRLRGRHPSYLYHEYLVDENTPFLFSEFMAQAAPHGLQYLAEAELHTMFSDELGAAASAWIDTHDSVIAQEQYMDFLRHRLFRQTLLCRAERALNRELDLDRFAQLAWHGSLVPPEQPDWHTDRAQPFATLEGGTCMVNHPLTRAALLELAECHPDALSFAELAARAMARLRAAGGAGEDRDALLVELVRLYLHQYLGAVLQPERFPRAAGERPCATPLAHAQVAAGLGHVASARHKPMEVDAFAARLIGYLDGHRRRADLHQALLEDFLSGRLRFGSPLPDRNALAAAVAENVGHMLELFMHQGLLAAAPTSP